MLRLRPRWLRAGRVAIALLSFPALALTACRNGTDPASTEPQGMMVVAKADTIITMLIDGRAQQRFPDVLPIAQYGQHPAWLDYARVLVHTVTSAGGPNVRVHALDLGTRALTRVTPS